MTSITQPLAGVRVVELAGIGPGPFAAMLLADLGAEVIRIERPGGVDEVRRDPVTTRGRAATHFVDLKSAEGRDLVLGLVETAELLIEGYRPGVMERLGLGPADCVRRNVRLVYGRMTGWGQSGPLAPAAGHDINYIGLAGVLHAIGRKGEKPTVPLNLIGDFGGGALYLVFGLLAALVDARATGRGRVVDAAMTDGAASLMAMILGRMAGGFWRDGERGVNSLDGGTPWYDTYETRDGKYFAVGANERPFYDELCRRLGLTTEEAAWRDHKPCWPALRARLGSAFRTRTREQWAAVFEGSDACASPVFTLVEAAAHPHNAERGTLERRQGVLQPAPAPRFTALGG
jgi:alpha-methylacyl-CoA racemase